MKNDLQQLPSGNALAKNTTVEQHGKNNFHVDHANNINQTLNVNVTYFSQQPGKRPLQVTRILNRNCYHLFVIGGEEFSSDCFFIPKDRALAKGMLDEDLYDRLSTLTPEAIEEIKSYPALFANKNTDYWGETDEEQETIYGFITELTIQDNGIKIYYCPLSFISQQAINNMGFDLGINTDTAITDLNQTRWTIKKIDLIQALTDKGIGVMAPTL